MHEPTLRYHSAESENLQSFFDGKVPCLFPACVQTKSIPISEV